MPVAVWGEEFGDRDVLAEAGETAGEQVVGGVLAVLRAEQGQGADKGNMGGGAQSDG